MLKDWIRGIVNWAYREPVTVTVTELTCLAQPPQPGAAEVVHLHITNMDNKEKELFLNNGFMVGEDECLLPQYPLMSKEDVLSDAGGYKTPR